jgi:hypothetical protein
MSKTHLIIPILKKYGIIDVLPKIRYYVRIYEKQLKIERKKEIEETNKIMRVKAQEEYKILYFEFLFGYFTQFGCFPNGGHRYKDNFYYFSKSNIIDSLRSIGYRM